MEAGLALARVSAARPRPWVALLFVLLACPLTGAQADGDEEEPWREDPFTRNEPAALAAAGYERFHPIEFGDRHGSRDVEEVLGDVEMVWIETEHFRIGSTLTSYKVRNEEKKRIAEELKALAEHLPRVKKNARTLEPWLRAHLYAQRAEQAYAQFQDMLGLQDQDFPTERNTVGERGYLGEGPYLGQPGKFLLLLFEKRSECGRYAKRYTDLDNDTGIRHTFERQGSLLLGLVAERKHGKDEQAFKSETELACELAFNLTHNLANGFTYYTFSMPVWITEGLAHYNGRQVFEEENNFTFVQELGQDLTVEWDWEPKVHGRVRHDFYPPAEELLSRFDWGTLKFNDQVMLWSRVDYLMSLGPEKFGQLIRRLKQRETGSIVPTPEQLLATQAAAIQEIYGFDLAGFDEAWARWVTKTYRSK